MTVTVTAGAQSAASTAQESSGTMVAGRLGDTLTLIGLDESHVEVTVKKTRRIPAETLSGYELHPDLFGIFVSVRNVADSPYTDFEGAFSLVDNEDINYSYERTYDLDDQLGELRIAPNDVRNGWVYFEVPLDRKPRLVQFTTNSLNIDYSRTQIGEWSLD